MALVIVTTDDANVELMHEEVHGVHLEDEHASLRVIERIAWAVNDADELGIHAQSYRSVPSG